MYKWGLTIRLNYIMKFVKKGNIISDFTINPTKMNNNLPNYLLIVFLWKKTPKKNLPKDFPKLLDNFKIIDIYY